MKNILIIVLLMMAYPVMAQDCFEKAGRDYRIDPDLLRAIAWQESKLNPSAIGKNRDHSIDVGLMQINSQHAPSLQVYGITMQKLHADACLNIYTGAYILAKAFKKWGVSWNAVGAYNAGFKESVSQAQKRYRYAQLIYANYRAIKDSKISLQN